MVFDEAAEMFQVLSPVIVGVGRDHVAVPMPTGEHVVVGEVTWIYGKRGDEEEAEKQSSEWTKDIPEFFLVPVIEIGCGFGSEEIQERENRKEVTKTDIQVSGDADEGIEENKEYRKVLGGSILEGGRKDSEEIGGGVAFDRSDDTEESVRRCDQKEKKERKGFLQAEDDGKVIW